MAMIGGNKQTLKLKIPLFSGKTFRFFVGLFPGPEILIPWNHKEKVLGYFPNDFLATRGHPKENLFFSL